MKSGSKPPKDQKAKPKRLRQDLEPWMKQRAVQVDGNSQAEALPLREGKVELVYQVRPYQEADISLVH